MDTVAVNRINRVASSVSDRPLVSTCIANKMNGQHYQTQSCGIQTDACLLEPGSDDVIACGDSRRQLTSQAAGATQPNQVRKHDFL